MSDHLTTTRLRIGDRERTAATERLAFHAAEPFLPPLAALFLLWRFGVLQHPIRRSRP